MLYPTINQLTQGKFNRYELAVATAKCARIVTSEYVKQRECAEKSITGNKETDRPIDAMISAELRDEKAVRVAVKRIYKGDFTIERTDESKRQNETDEDVVIDSEETAEENVAEAEEAEGSENE